MPWSGAVSRVLASAKEYPMMICHQRWKSRVWSCHRNGLSAIHRWTSGMIYPSNTFDLNPELMSAHEKKKTKNSATRARAMLKQLDPKLHQATKAVVILIICVSNLSTCHLLDGPYYSIYIRSIEIQARYSKSPKHQIPKATRIQIT